MVKSFLENREAVGKKRREKKVEEGIPGLTVLWAEGRHWIKLYT